MLTYRGKPKMNIKNTYATLQCENKSVQVYTVSKRMGVKL